MTENRETAFERDVALTLKRIADALESIVLPLERIAQNTNLSLTNERLDDLRAAVTNAGRNAR